MSSSKLISFSLLLLLILLVVVSATASQHYDVSSSMGWTMGEDEFDLGSESTRRMLATSRYISYNSLRRDSVPCSQRGASYYNCRPGAQGNPYSRGCSAITRCRS